MWYNRFGIYVLNLSCLLELECIPFNIKWLRKIMNRYIFSFAVALVSSHPYLAAFVVLIAILHLEIKKNGFRLRIGK